MNNTLSKKLDRNEIRRMYKKGYCPAAIARKYDCRVNAVMHHISDLVIPIRTTKNSKSKLTHSQVKQIRIKYIKKGLSAPRLAKFYNVSESTILNVIHGIYYRYVPGEVINKSGMIYQLPENYACGKAINTKGRLKSGLKLNGKRRPHGCLIPLVKKYGVSKSTICKWIKKGKIEDPANKCKMQQEKTPISVAAIIAETSYADKTYAKAERSIAKWLPIIEHSNLSTDDKNQLIYILKSRKQNIHILKNHFHKNS